MAALTEPSKLSAELAALSARLHQVSLGNYKQVLDAQGCLIGAGETAGAMEAAASRLSQGQVPQLREALAGLASKGRVLMEAHKQTMATVELHASLVDLLAIPQLMDTCARSGAIEEALELCSFARTLRARHGAISSSLAERSDKKQHPGTAIVDQVAMEVEASGVALRRQLLQQLRGPVDLPTCLRVVSYLKRIDAQRRKGSVDDDTSLRRQFLECRDAYLQQQQLATVERGDRPYQTALKAVQKNRELWFDVITQFQAIFGSEDAKSRAILARYIGANVEAFMDQLRGNVAKLDNCGELATVYELTVSFASSLARVGADFGALLPPVFIHRLEELMSAQWQTAAQQFRDAMSSGDWGEALPPAASTKDEFAPPPSLLAFPIAVELVNALLRSFNELRAFAPVEVAQVLAGQLRASLDVVAQGVEEYSTTRPSMDSRLGALVALLADDAVPFIARCFAAVMGQASIDVGSGVVRRLRALQPTLPASTTPSLAASAQPVTQ